MRPENPSSLVAVNIIKLLEPALRRRHGLNIHGFEKAPEQEK